MKRMDTDNVDNQMILSSSPKAIGRIQRPSFMFQLVSRNVLPAAGPSGIKNAKKKKVLKNFTASNNERYVLFLIITINFVINLLLIILFFILDLTF